MLSLLSVRLELCQSLLFPASTARNLSQSGKSIFSVYHELIQFFLLLVHGRDLMPEILVYILESMPFLKLIINFVLHSLR